MEPVVQKKITDLGASAYMLMHGYKVVGRVGKAIIFEVEQSGLSEFEQKVLEYLSSEYHRFDACLMSLKKIGEIDS